MERKITLHDLEICYALRQEAHDILRRLERMKAYATQCSPTLPGTAYSAGGHSDHVGDGVAAYMDLEKEGRRKSAAFLLHAKYVEEAIETLSDSTQRKALRLRYLDGLTWAEIEKAICYSESQRKRIVRKALAALGVG